MLDRETRNRIDSCRNILLGKISDPISQVKQITIGLIYKFMDDMDKESIEMGGIPSYFIGDFEKYSWSNIFNPRIGGEEMIVLYSEGIEKMNQNSNLQPFLRDIFKDAYLPFRDPSTLKLFLKEIDWFHYSHSEKLGDSFEYLLSILGSQGDAGQFRTPRHIIDFIVELIQPKKNEKINDPACGTSGFLISSYKYILKNNTKKNLGDLITPDERNKLVENISGYDISPDMVRLSLVNLYLHNFSNPKIYEYDSLTSEDRWNEYYDVILANPPFMSPKGGIKPHKRFSIQSNRAEVLFVDYIMEHLTPKGRSGIVVPEGIIFQSGTAYKSLRKSLVDKYLVGVISLPSGIFQPYSGVKTSILILDKELSQKTNKIFFGKVDNDGFDLGAQRREIDKNDLPIITKEITEYLGSLKNGKVVESEKLTYVTKTQILESVDIGLSYDRYSINDYKKIITKFTQVKLNTIIELQSGGRDKGGSLSSGIPSIGGEQISSDGKIRFDKMKYVSNSYYEKMNRGQLKVGDVLMVKDGATTGKVGFYRGGFEKCAVNEHVYILRCNEKILPTLLYNILKTDKFQNILKPYIKGIIGGVSSEIKDIEIPLPPIKDQEEIVRELEQYQKIVDGAKQVVDNYNPVIDIDPSWEIMELGDVYLENLDSKRKPVTKSVRTNGEYPYYGASGIVDYVEEYIFNEPLLLISEDGANLITRNTPIAFSVDGKIWVNNHAHILKFNSLITQKYIENYINQIDITKFVTGSAQPKLNQQNLNLIPIPIPPIEIQQSIVERIEGERQIIEGNKKLIEIYTQKIQDRINKIWGE
jgi:type I restriction enzyme M protein